jgi:hypothetical protein
VNRSGSTDVTGLTKGRRDLHASGDVNAAAGGDSPVAAKAGLTGADIDPRDPDGDEELVSRFEQAGYSDEYADQLAEAWATDSRTAKIIGALVIEAGCCG